MLQVVFAQPGTLPEMPINPEWILEGHPKAFGQVFVQSADKLISSGVWECSTGRFRWDFGWDEFVSIVSGEVEITESGGRCYRLRPGDIAHFPLGLQTQWRVLQPVRKVFTIRTAVPFELK